MGTPEFAVPSLKKLIEAGHEIRAVITQPDRPVGRKQIVTPPPVKLLALEHGLRVYQPGKIRTPEARELFEPVLKDVDACVVAAYGKILPGWMLEAPRLGCVNVHSSLLPKYRGAAPINWAIACGERETGVTIMQMDAGMDTGAILLQGSTPIGEIETAAELTPRLAELGAGLLIETLEKLERGELVPRAQNDDEASNAPMLKREDGLVDWKLTAREIIDRLRGFTPFPGCHTCLNGLKIEIVRASVAAGSTAEAPGAVTEVGRDHFDVACGGGTVLCVSEVQPAGKRAMTVRDFLNGVRLSAGARFGE